MGALKNLEIEAQDIMKGEGLTVTDFGDNPVMFGLERGLNIVASFDNMITLYEYVVKQYGGLNRYLCYFELHVGPHTFYVHQVIRAGTQVEAEEKFAKMNGNGGEHFHLQKKGFLGLLKDNLHYLEEIGGGL